MALDKPTNMPTNIKPLIKTTCSLLSFCVLFLCSFLFTHILLFFIILF